MINGRAQPMALGMFAVLASTLFAFACTRATQLEDHLATCETEAECPNEYNCAADHTCVRGSGMALVPVTCSGACDAGQYLVSPCTDAADRVCASCTPIADCANALCTTASDPVCTSCGANHYLLGNACRTCAGACPPGESLSAACTATTDRACTSCTVIPGCTSETCTNPTDQVCSACAGGTYLDANQCKSCTVTACPTGQYESAACSAGADRVCSPCTAIPSCTSETCTTSTDHVCSACAGGTYLDANQCKPCSVGACPAEQYQSAACSAGADRICSMCRPACDAGEYETSACAGSNDRTCALCGPVANCTERVCTTGTNETCTTCNAGYYPNAGACAACPVHCTTCTGSTACTSCAPGYAGPLCTPLTPTSCKAILIAGGSTGDGVYTIDPDGPGGLGAYAAYCDMTFDDGNGAGGWTLIQALVAPNGPASAVAGLPRPNTSIYLPVAEMQSLANLSSQIHVRTPGLTATQSATSVANTAPIVHLRAANYFNTVGEYPQSQYWTGPFGDAYHFDYTCAVAGTWPNVYHGCGTDAMHILSTAARWTWAGGNNGLNTSWEIYVR